jgi:hypothetical protein
MTTPEAPVLASEDFEEFEEVEPLLEEVTFCDEDPEVFGAALSFFWVSEFKESTGALDWSLAFSFTCSLDSAGAEGAAEGLVTGALADSDAFGSETFGAGAWFSTLKVYSTATPPRTLSFSAKEPESR